MEKNTSTSGPNKDSFKNAPHVGGATGSSATLGSDVSTSSPSAMINNVKSRIVDQAGPAMDSIRTGLRGFQDTSRPYVESAESYVRRYPMYSVLGAVAVGAAIGMLIARPSYRV